MAKATKTPVTAANNPNPGTPAAPLQATPATMPAPVGCGTTVAPVGIANVGPGPLFTPVVLPTPKPVAAPVGVAVGGVGFARGPVVACPPQFAGMATSTGTGGKAGKPRTPATGSTGGGGNPTGGVQYTVLGLPVAAVLRYCGSRGLTPGQAAAAVTQANGGTPVPCSPHTVRTQVQRGRHGVGGLPVLTPEQQQQLGLTVA
jgi:hypothetical protein